MAKYTFIKYQSLYDEGIILYGLEKEGVERIIDNARFIEVTPDFARVQMVRADSLKPIGKTEREY